MVAYHYVNVYVYEYYFYFIFMYKDFEETYLFLIILYI